MPRVYPWPSAFSFADKKMLKIWKAKALDESEVEGAKGAEPGTVVAVAKDSFSVKTGNGVLQILEVQLEGKKRMDVKSFLLGYKLQVGDKLQ